MVRTLRPLPGARPLRGWDFGHVCPVVLLGQLDVWGRLQILREVILDGASLGLLIGAAKSATIDLWSSPRDGFDAGDPAGETMTDLGMVKQVMAEQGLVLHTSRKKSHQDSKGSYAALRGLMQIEVVAGTEGRTPKFLVDGRGCPMLVRALSGGFHKSPRHPYAPVPTHPYKDVCDALRYLWDNLGGASEGFDARARQAATMDEIPLLSSR